MIRQQIILLWEYWNEYEGKNIRVKPPRTRASPEFLLIYTAQYSRGDKKSLRWNIYNLGVEVACGFVFDVVIVIDDQGWVLSLQSS